MNTIQTINIQKETELTFNTSTQTVSAKQASIWEDMEFNRFGYGAMIVLCIVCANALVVAFGGFGLLERLIITIAPCLAILVSFMTLLPMRIIVGISAIAILLDIIFIGAALFGF